GDTLWKPFAATTRSTVPAADDAASTSRVALVMNAPSSSNCTSGVPAPLTESGPRTVRSRTAFGLPFTESCSQSSSVSERLRIVKKQCPGSAPNDGGVQPANEVTRTVWFACSSSRLKLPVSAFVPDSRNWYGSGGVTGASPEAPVGPAGPRSPVAPL